MAKWTELPNLWKNVRELDLRPIRQEATRPILLALVGDEGSGRQALADQLRRDPARPGVSTNTPILVARLEAGPETKLETGAQVEAVTGAQLSTADLIILVARPENAGDARHLDFVRRWNQRAKKLLVFCNLAASGAPERASGTPEGAAGAANLVIPGAAGFFSGAVTDERYLQKEFVPLVLDLLADRQLPLARQFPLFRVPVALRLINDACLSNTAYSLSTGVAEIVPVLDVPLNITDMLVLTKSQAFLVYRLGLAFGFSTRWQDYVAEFGSVIGGGFVWRQVARSLVGLIPVWGLLPKVAVAYAGTYVIGHTILRWYLTGRHISPEQIQALYRQAFSQGKAVARGLIEKLPRPRLGWRRAPAALPAGEIRPRRGLLSRRKPAELPPPAARVCPQCGKVSASDAFFCQYCGKTLEIPDQP